MFYQERLKMIYLTFLRSDTLTVGDSHDKEKHHFYKEG